MLLKAAPPPDANEYQSSAGYQNRPALANLSPEYDTMPAIHIPYPPLMIKAGAHARKLLARQGLPAVSVTTLPGAAGGPRR